MHPDRRFQSRLQPYRHADGKRAKDQDYEDGRAVTGVVGRQIEIAMRATVTHIEQTGEQAAASTARAFAPHTGDKRRQRGPGAGRVHRVPLGLASDGANDGASDGA